MMLNALLRASAAITMHHPPFPFHPMTFDVWMRFEVGELGRDVYRAVLPVLKAWSHIFSGPLLN
jgi:hypothetical protein